MRLLGSNRMHACRLAAAVAASVLVHGAAATSFALDDAQATWRPTPSNEARAECLAWLDALQAAPGLRAKVLDLWPEGEAPIVGPALLDRVAKTGALLDARATRLYNDCEQAAASPIAPTYPWLEGDELPPTLRDNLRLYLARWLVHERFYDEALAHLRAIEIDDVFDPSTLLFFRAVACQRLLEREEGLDAIGRLLDARDAIEGRYAAVAELMRLELEDLEDESLDHVARRMEDVERRLDKGRAGEKIRGIEGGIIESLDKMIEKLEQQKQQQQGQGVANSIQSQKPAEDSLPMGGKGAGDVDRKPIGDESGWGNLPDKERERVMQAISREFPSHYRHIIEQYFRQLADEESPAPRP